MPDFEDHVRSHLGSLGLTPDRETEIVEEIAQHMLASYEEARGRGATEREAFSFAESPFVPWDLLRRNIELAERSPVAETGALASGAREQRDRPGRGIGTMLASRWQDLRFGIRTFRRRPFFSVVAIGSLALGIGTTTTMFSVVDGVLLRRLPFTRPDELVTVWTTWPARGWNFGLNWSQFVSFREHGDAFQEVAVHRPHKLTLTGTGRPAQLLGGVATGSLFTMLGVRPQLGRLFHEGEDGHRAARVVVLSGELWRTRFGSDSAVIGRTITLDEVPYEVLGVLPTGFRLRSQHGGHEIETGVDTGERDVWLPVGFDGVDVKNWDMNLEFVGRVRPGVTLAQAHAEADVLLRDGEEQSEMVVHLVSLKEEDTAGLRFPLFLLLGAAGCLLLVTCANVANLLVSEAIRRQQEIKIRVALGASRFRIIGLLLTESSLLGLGGGLLGLALASIGVHVAVTVGPYLPGLEGVRVDHGTILFAVSLGTLTSILFGVTPAVRSARLAPSLRESGGSRLGQQFQRHVIALVFAVTTVLLVAGGLLTRSFSSLSKLDTGFRARDLAAVRLPVLPNRYQELGPRNAFFARVIAEIEAIPGVIQASGADNLPFPGAPSHHPIARVGRDEELQTPLRRVLADYHQVMGIPLLEGRAFAASDVEGNTPVVIISEGVARHFWPGESAVGGTLYHFAYGNLTVVGVVGDVLEGWVGTQARPMVYLPLAQIHQNEISLIAKTAGDPAPIIPLLREAVWAVDPEVGVAMEATMEALVADSTLTERYRTLLVVFFGLSAALLAAVGIFGVTARSVALRTRELGIRVALGATGRGLIRMILRQSLTAALAGTTVGLIGALWVSQLLAGFLFGVEPTDPLTYAVVISMLVGVCLIAAYLPSRRIAKVDPVEVLRAE